MKIFSFLGVKRFNDIQKVRRKNIVFKADNRVKVGLRRARLIAGGKVVSFDQEQDLQYLGDRVGEVVLQVFWGHPQRGLHLPGFPQREACLGSGRLLQLRQDSAQQGEGDT